MSVKCFKMLAMTLIAVVLTAGVPVVSQAAGSETASAVFTASECDADGNFTLSLAICNAKFNTFQFVIRYDQATVTPVDKSGNATTAFSVFAQKKSGTEWLSTIGTSIDTEKGLIDFTGFVTPGYSAATDELTEYPGYVNAGSTGIGIYNFRFRKTGSANAVIEIAAKSSAKAYSSFLPEGAAIVDAGIRLPAEIRFVMPASVGSGGSYKPVVEAAEPVITKAQRLQNTIALQIGNYGAAANGALIRIDPDNSAVRPYLDESGRTMMPVRFVAERLGATVEWNGQANQITIRSTDRTIVMTIGAKTYTINGVAYTMDTEPIIVRGWDRTVVPIRFVSEALGRAVEWDAANQLVLITDSAEPWQVDRDAEKQATQSILLVISDLVRDFT